MTDSRPAVSELFPPIPLEAWADTKETLHRFLQIVGKVRLDQAPFRNHWWHVPFHLSGRGLTTRLMGRSGAYAVDFDFIDHRLVVNTVSGRTSSFELPGLSVATFHDSFMDALGSVGVEARIWGVPFDLSDTTPFAEDDVHCAYDPFWVRRYWQVLSEVSLVLEEYAGHCNAKTSPVHHFWHTFDIAVTRFSDRLVDQPASADPVTREAYSHEVISAGFWFGDQSFAEPAFYGYTAPEPPGLVEEPLVPEAARWVPSRGAHLAVLTYDDMRATSDPRATALAFLDSAYRAGARRAGWDVQRLRTSHAPHL